MLSPRLFFFALFVAAWIAGVVGQGVARALSPVAQLLTPTVRVHGVDDGAIQLGGQREQSLQLRRGAVKRD